MSFATGVVVLFLVLLVETQNVTGLVHQDKVFHVHAPSNGTINLDCFVEPNESQSETYRPVLTCQTLELVAKKISAGFRNITIFIDSSVSVGDLVTFRDIQQLTIQGKNGSDTVLSCSCGAANKNFGLLFLGVEELKLLNIDVVDCCGSYGNYSAAVQIHDSSDITISYVHIKHCSLNSALIVVNTFNVRIKNSRFEHSGYRNEAVNNSYAGGLHVEITTDKQSQSIVSIMNCVFYNNSSPQYPDEIDTTTVRNWNGHSLGGGIGIVLQKNCTGVSVRIRNCTVMKNSATWGGGLELYLQDEVHNNNLSIFDSWFMNNSARIGGGGVEVSLHFHPNLSQTNNHIRFRNVKFEQNYAKSGAGTAVSARFSMSTFNSYIKFVDCTWLNNTGPYAPAVDISPSRFQLHNQGFLPTLTFKNSHIKENTLEIKPHVIEGVFLITLFTVCFQGTQNFEKNGYSAIYVKSGQIIFKSNSSAKFLSNYAIRGGAISMHGFSELIVHSNSLFQFINNSAAQVGGAIYYESGDQREYFEGRSCFLKHRGRLGAAKRNLTFIFTGNKAKFGGTSIYSETFISCNCIYSKRAEGKSPAELFSNIGNFSFDESIQMPNESSPVLGTGASNVSFLEIIQY